MVEWLCPTLSGPLMLSMTRSEALYCYGHNVDRIYLTEGAGGAKPWQSIADSLACAWTVRRTMIDFLARTSYKFTGNAVVTANAFTERGVMQIGAHAMPASRAYKLERRGHLIVILRADGSEFIELEPKATQNVQHHCGADVYAGRFLFRGPDEWAEAWRVKGPRKNYASLSRFRRLDAGDRP
ncbi:DUF6314 family protein [Mesorhizobium neociceri]|uniref:DUF6314 domain-containing protein n=1 Tax=Mesorhizobium neociceri TaxID=1307853 RepID=A0A838B6T3_9HYPH|nr:DUF6314 family protein [Mesorhizobium neociceri]MBA1141691.1 hypothetical protein [Mesorhizobium neociceri]